LCTENLFYPNSFMICPIPLKQDSNEHVGNMNFTWVSFSSKNIVYLGFSSLGVYNWITLKYITGFSPDIYIYIYIDFAFENQEN
jgi:hypothetical protein